MHCLYLAQRSYAWGWACGPSASPRPCARWCRASATNVQRRRTTFSVLYANRVPAPKKLLCMLGVLVQVA
eukprot:1521112-Prymnesium_polylepis.1